MGSNSSVNCGLPSTTTPNEEVLKFLAQVVLFKQLPKELFPVLAAIATKIEFDVDKDIVKQGDYGEQFYVIMEGAAKVVIDGKEVAKLKPYDYFGEKALLHDAPRAATVTTETKVAALSISRDLFQQLGLHQKLQFAHRKAVGGAGNGVAHVKPPINKTPEERKLMANAIKSNANLRTIVSNMDEKALNSIIDIAWQENVPAGFNLIEEGDAKADYFYIVQEGAFEFQVAEKNGNEALGLRAKVEAIQNVGSVSKGGSFGELALLYLHPRAATVKATESSVVWVIDRGNFKSILVKSADAIALDYIQYLDKVEILAPLKKEEKEELAKILREMFFDEGEMILKQGQEGDNFYILIEGEVDVIQDNEVVARLKAEGDQARFFGEQALMKKEPRNATIKVVSKMAKTLTVDKKSFDLILGPLAGRGQPSTQSKEAAVAPAAPEEPAAPTRQFGLVKMKDLQVIGLLGNGGFGSVSLVEHKTTKDTYALKMLSKGYVVQSHMEKSIVAEKDIQLMCDSVFIVKLYETYSDDQNCWFLLEAALGGELYATYSRKGFHGRVKFAMYYAAGVVFAFEHMHTLKVVYRDLKPENLLLTDAGHIKLTDMGLAKVVAGKTYTTCGTPDYFAPEMVASSGHSHGVDWWTLGILIFEFMSGHPPFETATPMQTYQKIAQGINKVAFPRSCRGPLEDLVKGLCHKTPAKRLPMKQGGTDNIKSHAWYKDFDWIKLQELTLAPPYVPDVKSKKDVSNFHARPQDAPPMIKYKDNGSGWDKGFATST